MRRLGSTKRGSQQQYEKENFCIRLHKNVSVLRRHFDYPVRKEPFEAFYGKNERGCRRRNADRYGYEQKYDWTDKKTEVASAAYWIEYLTAWSR